jgi:hypothetical protein
LPRLGKAREGDFRSRTLAEGESADGKTLVGSVVRMT